MNSDITISELADKTVDNFSTEDDVFIMNI